MKLKESWRPYLGPIIGGAATVGGAFLGHKVPFLAPYINVETVSATVMTWLFATSGKTVANALGINKSNASTGTLSANVPAVVVPQNIAPAEVSHPVEVVNPGTI